MADQSLQVHPDMPGSGKKIDCEEVTVGGVVVQRQRIRVAGLSATELQDVRNVDPASTDYGAVVRVAGGAAHGAPVSGIPFLQGVEARTSLGTAVANGDVARQMGDPFGRAILIPHAPRELITDEVLTITASTAVASFALSAASTFYDIASIVFANSGASATEVVVYNNDGTTVRFTMYVPARDTRGVVFQVPLKAAAVNVVWKMKTTTSTSSMKTFVQYVLNK